MSTSWTDDEQRAIENCDSEPIHLVGTVQPFGWLLAVMPEPALTVRHVSENVRDEIGLEPAELLDLPLEAVLTEKLSIHKLRNVAGHAPHEGQRRMVGTTRLAQGRGAWTAFAHRSSDHVVIEFQPDELDAPAATLARAQLALAANSNVTDLDELLNRAVDDIRDLSGYDRVKVYRFLSDGAGEVVAESRNVEVESYLGLRFPAFDIPPAARKLYASTPIRVIHDVDADPIPILASGAATAPVDLSLALLRGSIPGHATFLRNMGVRSTMSLPIVVDGVMWGLVSMHHREPKNLDPVLVSSCEILGRSLSMLIQHLVERQRAERRNRCEYAAGRLFTAESAGPLGFAAYWQTARSDLATLLPCDGVAMLGDERVDSYGSCPSDTDIEALVRNHTHGTRSIVALDSIKEELSPADPTAGALIIGDPIPGVQGLLFFRDETVQNVRWAGNTATSFTTKPDGETRLQPRASFAEYIEQSRGRCDPWTTEDLDLASTLADVFDRIADTRGAAERDRERLGLMVRELNHRVRNILTLVRSLIGQTGGQAESIESYVSSLERRIGALAGAHNLLTEQGWSSVELRTLIEETVAAFDHPGRVALEGPSISVEPDLASILALVIHELTSNAAKYGALSVPGGTVQVEWRLSSGRFRFEWQERGGPSVPQERTEGFGTSIIRNALPFEFDAEVALDFEPSGVRMGFVMSESNVVSHVALAESGDDEGDPSEAAAVIRTDGGVRALLLEDDFVISRETVEQLGRLGIDDVRVESSIAGALEQLEPGRFDIALLDANVRGDFSGSVADRCDELGVPYLFITGYGSKDQALIDKKPIAIVTKPASDEAIANALARAGLSSVQSTDGTAIDLRVPAGDHDMAWILILEDDVSLAGAWQRGLEAEGHAVALAQGRTEAEDWCRRRQFDLVIADIFVAGADGKLADDGGFTLISHLRSPGLAATPEWGTEVPILAVTGSGKAHGFDALEYARHMGATRALRKPISLAELLETCAALTRGATPLA